MGSSDTRYGLDLRHLGDFMASININRADDRAYVREHIETAQKLAYMEARRKSYALQVSADIIERNKIATRILAGLTRQNPAAASVLGMITDIEIEQDPSDLSLMILHTNAEASIYRASLQGGFKSPIRV